MDIHELNKLIEGLRYTGTIISSARIFPISEFDPDTNEFKEYTKTYDVDFQTEGDSKLIDKVISDLEKFTNYNFIVSSINGNGN